MPLGRDVCHVGVPCRLSSGTGRGLGPHWRLHVGQQLREWGSLGEGAPGRSPFTFYIRSPWCCQPAQVARRSLYSRAGAPGIPAPGPRDTPTHVCPHRQKVVCPSGWPRAQAWARRPQWLTAHHQQHGELRSALTLTGAQPAGRWPFTSEDPHHRVGLEAAGHGQTRNHPPRSWSWECPGRPVSTAQKAPTGPGTHQWTSQ